MARSDTIAAISTPPGKGGVAVIRISGSDAVKVAQSVFFPISKRDIEDYPPRTQIYGRIKSCGEAIDDGMLTYFKEGASYTGEQTVEISCHGGLFVTELVLTAVLTSGAVPAKAGEFTRRAFLNGRLSLSETEAIGLLLEAKNEEQIRLSSKDSRERLSSEIKKICEELTNLLGSVYARIDYPDEDLGDFTDEETLAALEQIEVKIDALLATYRTGHSIAEGIDTVICGKPNVGKSSLYNLICGKEAAIVTDVKGTTRDVLESTVSLGRVTLRLADTAGIRSSGVSDEVERIGISRSLKKIEECELIIAMFDASSELDCEDLEIIGSISDVPATRIAIYNKVDKMAGTPLANRSESVFDKELFISAKHSPSEALSEIGAAVEELFCDGKISPSHDAIIYSARQRAELTEAKTAIEGAIGAIRGGVFADAVSSDIEIALGAVSRVDGRAVSEAVVDNIFSRFCVGK